MTGRCALIALLFAFASAQSTTQSQQFTLDPNAGPLKLRIVFQSDNSAQLQQSPCSTGNCQATATVSPCASGNCGSVQTSQANPCSTVNCNGPVAGSANVVPSYDNSIYTTTTSTPVTIPATTNSAPFKIIRVPSYSNSYSGCSSSPCNSPRFVFAQPPCFGNPCGGPKFLFPRRRHFFGPRPLFIGNNANRGNIAIPDIIYKDGRAIRAPIRVPSSYQDGNPVFNIGK